MRTPQQHAKDVFVELISNVDPEHWTIRLAELCGGNTEVRNRVVALLHAHQNPDSYLENPAFDPDRTVEQCGPFMEVAGAQVGSYKLLQQIGEGGMGLVFMAEQTLPVKRRVALKIVKPGMDSRQVIARFEAERQALALMDHPNIAKVFDAGTTTGGRPYFVMELVKGVPITNYCDEYRLTPRERLGLFLSVCQAVQHAHLKGVIHRDLKPSNVLIAAYDGKPVPKVIDFGVAKATGPKLTEKTMFTEFGSVIGTLEYMSPEQAELNQLDIDTRSDVYSLGVLLYELLTGTTPLEQERIKESAFHEILRFIREEEPPKPSTRLSTSNSLPVVAGNRGTEATRLIRVVRGELDWIVMKSLEKDRNRRYESASALGTDLERYLSSEAVQACPPSAWYRFRKMTRRNKVAIVTTGLVAASLLIGTAVSLWQMTAALKAEAQAQNSLAEAVAAKERATEAEELATERLAAEQAAREEATREAKRATEVSKLLKQVLESPTPDTGHGSDYTVHQMLREFADTQLPKLTDQPELEAELRSILGISYLSLKLPDEAKPLLTRALEIRKELYSDDHPAVAESLRNLAVYHLGTNNLVEQAEYAKQSVEMYRRLGIENEERIKALHILQVAWLFLEQHERAVKVYKEAQQVAESMDEMPPAMSEVMSNYANVLTRLGRLDEAKELALESLQLLRKLRGNQHRQTGWGLQILAIVHMHRDEMPEAEEAISEAIEIFSRFYDDDHSSIRSSVRILATALQRQEKYDDLAALTSRYESLFGTKDFAPIAWVFPAEVACGKNVVFSGWIKTEHLDGWAALWWDANKGDETIAFDNMKESAPEGTTDWKQFEIKLAIPVETDNINFGVLISGKGRAWFDSLKVTIDGEEYIDDQLGLGFESPNVEHYHGRDNPLYRKFLDRNVVKNGLQSLRMESVTQPFLVPAEILEEYVGQYEMEYGVLATIRREDEKIFAQLTGQPQVQVYPESETKFNYRDIEASIRFERDEKGDISQFVLHQNGKDHIAKRRRVGEEPVEIEINPESLDALVGEYRYDDDLSFTVTRERSQLWVRLTGQRKMKVYPKSKSRFFYKPVVAEIEFHENESSEFDALTLYQGGAEVRAERINEPSLDDNDLSEE